VDVLKKLRQWYASRPYRVARDQETEKVERSTSERMTISRNVRFLGADRKDPRGASQQRKKMSGDDLPATSYSVGDFTIDFDKHTVAVDGGERRLTQIEFKIVELLARQPERPDDG
jgi:DNA-binding response OmpR family regulator